MKYLLLVIAAVLVSCTATRPGQSREERNHGYIVMVDEIMLSQNYKFIPYQMKVQPAGTSHNVYNPLHYLIINSDGAVEIYMPYYRMFEPLSLMRGLVPMEDYRAVKNRDKWTVTFSAKFPGTLRFHFKLIVDAVTESAILEMATVDTNTISYDGKIEGFEAHYDVPR